MFEMDIVVFFIVGIFFLLIGYRPPWWTKKSISSCKKTIKDIPGPFPIPILGTRWIYSRFGSYSFNQVHEFYRDMFQQNGPIIKEEALFNVPVISTKDKNDIEKVFRHCGRYPVRPPTEVIAHYRKQHTDRYASTGLANEQGLSWHNLRVNLTTELTSTRTINQFLPDSMEVASDWCKLLRKARDENGLVKNLESLTARLGLEATCSLVLGRRMGFLESEENHSDMIKNLAAVVKDHFLAARDTYYGLPFWKLWKTGAYTRLAKSEEALYTMVSEIIANSDAELSNSAIFHAILGSPVDERDQRATLIDLVAAGIQTLSNSTIFLLDLIGRHPEVQQKLRVEEENSSYLKACIFESFRLLPTANCIARVLEQDLDLSGYNLPTGTVVLCHTWQACLEEKYFPQANEFRPERWTGTDKADNFNKAMFLVTPFGVGRRSCPGKRFVEQMLAVVLRKVVENFEFECTEPLKLQFEFLLSPKGPINMKFIDRTS